MRKKHVLSVIVIALCLLQCVATTYTVKADKTIDTISDYGLSMDSNNCLYHSSGKFVYVWLDTVTEKAYAEIFGSGGSYEAQIEEQLAFTASHEIAVIEWDSDEFVIIATGYDSSALHKVSFTLCNINTYTHTEYVKESSTQVYNLNRGSWVMYDETQDLIFVFAQFGSGGSTPYPRQLFVYTFDGDSHATTLHTHQMETGTTTPWGMIQGFIGEGVYGDKAYLIIPKDADNQKPVYYEYDLDGYSITELATHPVTARYHDDNDWRFQDYLGGDIVLTGTYIYLYHTWCYGYQSGVYRFEKIIQHRLIFNNTLDVANLTAQSEIVAIVAPNFGSGSTPSWITGYENDYDDFVFYYANLAEGEITDDKLEMTISNWLDYSGGAGWVITQLTSDANELKFYDEDDAVRRDFTSPFQVNENTKKAYVYTNLYMPKAEYSLGMTYSPADDPQFTDTSYRYTITALRNNLGFVGTILGYFDGSNVISSRTSANGQLQFTLTTSLSGYHNVTVVLYDGGVKVDDYSSVKLFQKEEAEYPTTDALLPQSVAVTTEFIPIALITLVPTGVFAKLLGLIGGVIGLNLGIIVAIGSGILPGYTIYIMLLFDAIFLVFMLKSEV